MYYFLKLTKIFKSKRYIECGEEKEIPLDCRHPGSLFFSDVQHDTKVTLKILKLVI